MFIHSWVLMDIQWMVHWWVLVQWARNIPVLGGYGTCIQNWIGYHPVLLQKNGWSIIQGDTWANTQPLGSHFNENRSHENHPINKYEKYEKIKLVFCLWVFHHFKKLFMSIGLKLFSNYFNELRDNSMFESEWKWYSIFIPFFLVIFRTKIFHPCT